MFPNSSVYGMSYKAENRHALLHKQYLSKHDFYIPIPETFTLKLYLICNNIQISNNRFSLENFAVEDTCHCRKRKQEPLLSKAASLRFTTT